MHTLAKAIDCGLRTRGTRERAEKARVYLKSEIDRFWVSVPDARSVVSSVLRGPDLTHDDAIDLRTGTVSNTRPRTTRGNEDRAHPIAGPPRRR
jgi:hypothetical protein